MTVIIRTNLPDFRVQLSAIKNDLQRKVLRRALAQGVQAFARKARQLAPVLQPVKVEEGRRPRVRRDRVAGTLRRAIYTMRTKQPLQRWAERYFVGIRQSAKYAKVKTKKGFVNRDAFYWRFQEAGWIPRGPGNAIRGGNRRRALERERLIARGTSRIKGRDYLKDAFNSQQGAALAAFERQIAIAMAKYK